MKDLGKKAEGIRRLKERGLFTRRLLFFTELPSEEDFKKRLGQEGFKDGDHIAVRFSSPKEAIHLPRSVLIESIDRAYKFLKENMGEDLVAIIHDFITPEFSGAIFMKGKKIYVNLLPGAWESLHAKSCDQILFEGNSATAWFSPNKKEALFVDGERLIKKEVEIPREKFLELISFIYDRIKNLNLEEKTLYEFMLTKDKELQVVEAKSKDDFDFSEFGGKEEVHEVSTPGDIEKWNNKQEILLSVPLDRHDDLVLHQLIEKIKPHKDKVYVRYGICSHPCIVLREFGIKTIPYNEDIEVLEVDLNDSS
ncbi:Uncharacterised protein [uncultured archaeon]|nr:Uncharacterised protein [uncultured archaeon]